MELLFTSRENRAEDSRCNGGPVPRHLFHVQRRDERVNEAGVFVEEVWQEPEVIAEEPEEDKED